MTSQVISQARIEGFGPFRIENYLATLDWKKIENLPEEEFVERYVGEMTRYFYEHGERVLREERSLRKIGHHEGLRPVCCSDCHGLISGPSDMRRYYGATLHGDCLAKRWENDRREHVKREGNRRGGTVRYWDRLIKLNSRISDS